jgi:hypothetical protein
MSEIHEFKGYNDSLIKSSHFVPKEEQRTIWHPKMPNHMIVLEFRTIIDSDPIDKFSKDGKYYKNKAFPSNSIDHEGRELDP